MVENRESIDVSYKKQKSKKQKKFFIYNITRKMKMTNIVLKTTTVATAARRADAKRGDRKHAGRGDDTYVHRVI